MRHVVVGVPEAPLEPLELQGAQVVDVRDLDGIKGRAIRRQVGERCHDSQHTTPAPRVASAPWTTCTIS